MRSEFYDAKDTYKIFSKYIKIRKLIYGEQFYLKPSLWILYLYST